MPSTTTTAASGGAAVVTLGNADKPDISEDYVKSRNGPDNFQFEKSPEATEQNGVGEELDESEGFSNGGHTGGNNGNIGTNRGRANGVVDIDRTGNGGNSSGVSDGENEREDEKPLDEGLDSKPNKDDTAINPSQRKIPNNNQNAEQPLAMFIEEDDDESDQSGPREIEFNLPPGTGWRWEVCATGWGKYKGRYTGEKSRYCWRIGSGKTRKYWPGGRLAKSREYLEQAFPRPGKGNRTKHRGKRHKPNNREKPNND